MTIKDDLLGGATGLRQAVRERLTPTPMENLFPSISISQELATPWFGREDLQRVTSLAPMTAVFKEAVTSSMQQLKQVMAEDRAARLSSLKAAVRASQADFSVPTFSVPTLDIAWSGAWNRPLIDGQYRIGALLGEFRRVQTFRRGHRVPARMRELFAQVIEFRRRASAWRSAIQLHIRDVRRRFSTIHGAITAMPTDIAYWRTQRTLHRHAVGVPPGRFLTARPHLTRGPNFLQVDRNLSNLQDLHALI